MQVHLARFFFLNAVAADAVAVNVTQMYFFFQEKKRCMRDDLQKKKPTKN